MIIKNGKNITAIYKGSTPISKIYKDLQVIWESFKKLVVSGISPLTLTNSVGKPLVNYKIYGNSRQTILPEEYQQIEYVETTGANYFDTGVPLKSGLKMVVDWVYKDSSSGNSYTGGHIGSPGNRWLVGSQRNTYYYFAVGTSNIATEFKYGNRDIVEAYWEDKASYIKVNGVKPTSVNFANYALADEPTYTFYLGAVNRNGSPSSIPKLIIYGGKFYQDDVFLRDYVPCVRKSDNAIGLYDLVNSSFLAMSGSGSLLNGVSMPAPSAPLSIESVENQIPVTIQGKNLYNFIPENITQNPFNNSGGTRYGFDLGVLPQGDYTISMDFSISIVTYIYLRWQNQDETWETQYITTDNKNHLPVTFTSDGTKHYYIAFATSGINTQSLALQKWGDVNYAQLERGDTSTEYTPYVEPITVSLYSDEPLRKIGEYADYMDYENQKIVRKVANVILDGSENWAVYRSNADNTVFNLDDTLTPLINAPVSATYMSHFQLTYLSGTASFPTGVYRFGYSSATLNITTTRLYVSSTHKTVDEFKAWLAENKPVIVYPLATPTEETIKLPEIQTHKGTNILDINTIVQPSNVEVTYKGK